MLAVPRPDRRWLASLGALAGAAAGLLPAWMSAGALLIAGLAVTVVVEPIAALLVMVSLAPLKTLIETEAALPLPVDLGQITFGAAVAAWGVHRVVMTRSLRLPRTRVLTAVAVIGLAFAPSLFVAQWARAWLTEFLKWIEIAVVVLIVADLGRNERWRWIAFGVVLAAALQAVIGLWQFGGGSGAPHLWIAQYRYFRAFGTFGQPNPFSAFMGLSLPLALGLAWGHARWAWQKRRRMSAVAALAVFYATFAGLLFAGLIAAWGRGAWLGATAALAVMVCCVPRRWWQGAIVGVGGGVIVLGLWMAGMVPASVGARIDNALTEFTGVRDVRGAPISDENFAIVERLAHWQAGYAMASAHPWLGVGLGNFEHAYPKYGLPSWPRPLGHAHNDYLNILAETGLVGLAGYLAGWSAIAWWTWRASRHRDPLLAGLALGLLGSWTHLAVHSFVDKLYVNNLFLHIGVMLGLLAIADSRWRTPNRDHAHANI